MSRFKKSEIVRGTIRLPRCWNRLVSTNFMDAEDEGRGLVAEINGETIDVTSERNLKGNDDPLPHYDDGRCVESIMPDGMVLSVDLTSGQNNYFAGAVIHNDKDSVYESEDPIETFDSPMEIVADNGKTYIVEIEWIGTDPYEKQS
jgi:hypothetical protein